MKTFRENPKLFPLLCLLTVAAAAMLRIRYFWGALEYDEIWSLENFAVLPVGRIFTELALPNNQPLNSLWIKAVTLAGLPVQWIRIHSLFAGILTVPLVGFISYVFSGGRKYAALWSMIFIAFSVPDAVYSSLARGYALQVFFLALYTAGLASVGRWRPEKKFLKYLPETAVLLGGAGAVLTLPTSVMYLAAVTLAAFLMRPGKPGKVLTVVLAAGAAFTLYFCISNFQQLNQARSWGTPITGVAVYGSFLRSTLCSLLTVAGVLTAVFAFVWSPVRRLPLLLIFLLPLAAAVVSNGGPPRTYIPFCAALAVASGCGVAELDKFCKKEYRIPAALLLLLLICCEFVFALPEWKTPDSREVFQASSKEPFSVLVVHRATSCYPLAWNNRPDIYTDFINRLLDQSAERELVMFDEPGRINGTDTNGSEKFFHIGIKGREDKISGVPCRRYLIEKATDVPESGSVALIIIRPVPEQIFFSYYKLLRQSNISMINLNAWLYVPVNRPECVYRYGMFAVKAGENCNLDWQAFLNNNGMISVYRFSGSSKQWIMSENL